MTFWLTALVIWVAAGARVGRVMVKPATTTRMAIVVAVAAVAAAATFAIPEIGLAIDHFRPDGIRGTLLSDRLVVSAWVLFTTATSVVAAAAWPVVSRRNLRRIAAVVYCAGLLVISITLVRSVTSGWVVVLLGSLFIVVTGLRHVDWTALGRGIALYTVGTLLVAGLSVLQIRREVLGAVPVDPGRPDWFWPAWQVAGLLIAIGAVWIVVELWARARLLLYRIRTLHRTLTKRFPEVVTHDRTGSTAQLKASDHVAHIMDALYLQSGGGVELPTVGPPPSSVSTRAHRVAQWARDPFGQAVVDTRWIAPPDGVSPRGWVQAIGLAFDATA